MLIQPSLRRGGKGGSRTNGPYVVTGEECDDLTHRIARAFVSVLKQLALRELRAETNARATRCDHALITVAMK